MDERKQRYKYVTINTSLYDSVAACANEWAERGWRLIHYIPPSGPGHAPVLLMELDLEAPKP